MKETSDSLTAIAPSERSERLGFSDIVKIRNRILGMAQEGIPVIRLEGGEPFPPTPDFVKNAMKRALDENQTRYAPSSGIPPLLDAIVAKLHARNGIDAERSNIIITSGGAHGLFCSFQATLNPGEEAIFLSPYWTPIRDQVNFCGGVPIRVPWTEIREGDPAAAVEKRIGPKTRVLYLNSPANPSGDVLNRSQLESIAEVAKAHDLIVLSDEAYEDLIYDEDHVSMASLPHMFERTITTFTLSKSFSMTGWRCGYVVADERFMVPIRKLVLNTTNGVSTPTQWAAVAAISDRSGYLATMKEEYRARRDRLLDGVLDAGFRCRRPAGAFYLFVDATDVLGADSWAAMEMLLDQTGIATVPGAVFGAEGETHLRMSYSNSFEVLDQAVAALARL